MAFYHIRRWALVMIALLALGVGIAGCGAVYPAPSSGTPAPTSGGY